MAASVVCSQQAAGLGSSPSSSLLRSSAKPETHAARIRIASLGSNWSAVANRQLLYRSANAACIPRAKRQPMFRVRAEASGSEKTENCSAPATFFKVEAILRPWRVTYATQALLNVGIRGATISDVRGFGAQGASKEREAGSEFSDADFLAKVKLEVVVVDEQVETVVNAIIDASRTGEFGDGKIFVSPVTDIIRIRTGERGLTAERMKGGRADQLAEKKTAS